MPKNRPNFEPTRAVSPCPGCGYELAGIPVGTCPECARPFTTRELRIARRRRGWAWESLREALRLGVWLWVAMLVGLGVLRVLEGSGFTGWAIPAAIAIVGLILAVWQRRVIGKRAAGFDEHAQGPGRWMRWSVHMHAGLAILIAVPIAGMAILLVLGSLLGVLIG